ncbi:porimin isoform X2 [Hemicordylus capensis]|uniref:porimin isoform X2 n=1 Tax=Hemicordylus capensis TaxID=884348 RepID=UPI00230434A3|nr:porimin isoform X2 [Hemicordylus capensis]
MRLLAGRLTGSALLLVALVPFCLAVQSDKTNTPASNISTISTTATITTTTLTPPRSTSATPAVPSKPTGSTIKPVSGSSAKPKPESTKTVPPVISTTATPKASAAQGKSSGFNVGSFIGGIVLTLGLLAIGYVGCRAYHVKRGVQYRTIDEHDAII